MRPIGTAFFRPFLVLLPGQLVLTGCGGEPSGPADVTPPTVVSVAPANASAAVVRTTSPTATFSEPVDPASVVRSR